jgi:outer membrane cobalamin receptor
MTGPAHIFRLYCGLLLSAILLFSQNSAAQSGDPDSIRADYHFNPVVVTAAKAPGHIMDLASSISVIGMDELQDAGSSSALTAMQAFVPGFFMTEWGVMGFGVAGQSAGKMSLRGLGGGANTHTLILRNGRPDFMGLMGCTVTDEFSLESVGRIEVVRGPGSFLYGTNATGGVINIIPRTRHLPGFETWLNSGYGSYNTYDLSAGHGGKTGAFDYYITAAGKGTQGHRTDASSSYQSQHGSVHAGYSAGRQTRIEFNANYSRIHLDDPGPESTPYDNNWYRMLRYGGDLTLNFSSLLGESLVKLHANFGDHEFYDGWNSSDRILGLMMHHTLSLWEGNQTTAGFDIKNYGGDAVDAGTDYDPHYLTEWAPYLHTQQVLFRWIIVSGGLRLEHHQIFGYELLPKAGIVIHPVSGTAIRVSAAKGFRSPSIRELYFWAPANPELGPDRTRSYEFGLTQKIGTALSAEGTLFRTDGSNLVQFSSPPPRWINSGSYTQYGYELAANYRPGSYFYASATWSQIDLTENTYNIPEKKLTLTIGSSWKRFAVNMDLAYIGDRNGAEWLPGPPVPVLHEMDSYTLVNGSIAYRLTAMMRVKLQIHNALNESYQSLYGYPMPGRTFRFFVSYGL